MKKLFAFLIIAISATAFIGLNYSSESNEHNSNSGNRIFTFKRSISQTDNASEIVRAADVLGVDFAVVRDLIRISPNELTVEIPSSNGKNHLLELKRSYPLSEDFKLSSKSGSGTYPVNYTGGIHFSGKINSRPNSIATISFFEGMVMGVLSDESGNFVLGPLKGDNGLPTGEYVFYNDVDLLSNSGFVCGVEGREERFVLPVVKSNEIPDGTDNPARLPVKVYFEADYQTYLDKGSNIQDVANYIAGMYNSVQAIYQAENLATSVSNIAVWTGADPYRNLNQSDQILFAFGSNTKDNFQGNLAHLISTRSGGLGGIAWINVLCAQYEQSSQAGRFAFSNIESTYNNFPTYSWTINVVTHEMGHNLGSRHTHSCTWPVGNGGALGAIDSCYNAEGGCFPTPRPRIGTIMSYCHLWPTNQGGGVNLASGFGPLPGDTIRLRYSQASCLDRELNSSERPVTYSLKQNHPNPFNPTTVISFTVPEVSNVTMSIYDMSGKLVAELISSKLHEPGFYDISFNAAAFGLSSGIYFYRMQAGGYVETKRMAMVK